MFNNRSAMGQYGGVRNFGSRPYSGNPQMCPPTMSIEEIEFEKEFTSWDQGFNEWKEEYSTHPDKAAYLYFEKRFLDVRDRLVERRAELKIKNKSRRPSTFEADLDTAAAAAESILSQFEGRPNHPMFSNHPDRPPLSNPNFTRPMPTLPPMMRSFQHQNQRNMIKNPYKKVNKVNITPNAIQTIENPMETFNKIIDEAKEEECPKRLPGSFAKRFKNLREKAEVLHNDEEKLFCKMYNYVTRKRNEYLFREREKKRELEGTGNSSNSTVTSSQYPNFIQGEVYNPQQPIQPNHQSSFANDEMF